MSVGRLLKPPGPTATRPLSRSLGLATTGRTTLAGRPLLASPGAAAPPLPGHHQGPQADSGRPAATPTPATEGARQKARADLVELVYAEAGPLRERARIRQGGSSKPECDRAALCSSSRSRPRRLQTIGGHVIRAPARAHKRHSDQPSRVPAHRPVTAPRRPVSTP